MLNPEKDASERDRIRRERLVHVPGFDTHGSVELAQQQLDDELVQVPFGLRDLDAATGGLRRGYFVVVGARTGNGKTTFLLNLLHRLHERGRYRVCYIGTEMDPSVLYRKWAALALGMNEDDVLANKWDCLRVGAKDEIRAKLEALKTEWRTWLPPVMSPTFHDLTDALAVARSADFNADIIILDHLHRVVPPERSSEREALNQLCVSLKNAAVDHNVIVVVAAQLRREEHGVFDLYRPPHQGSFLGSSAIEGNADVALGLFRPLKRITSKQERAIRNGDEAIESVARPNTMAARLLKHRFRGTAVNKTVLLFCDGQIVEDYAWQYDDDANGGENGTPF